MRVLFVSNKLHTISHVEEDKLREKNTMMVLGDRAALSLQNTISDKLIVGTICHDCADYTMRGVRWDLIVIEGSTIGDFAEKHTDLYCVLKGCILPHGRMIEV